MTRHVFATFYEKCNRGFILGSDSRIGDEDSQSVSYGEKYFKGSNYIGLFMGNIDDSGDLAENKISEDNRDAFLKSLDDIFEDISVGKSYSHIHLLQSAEYYRLNIAIRKKDALEVYSVTNMEEPKSSRKKFRLINNPHIAQRKYIFKRGKKDIGGFVVLAGQMLFPFFNIQPGIHFNFEKAKQYVIEKLEWEKVGDPDYNTGDLYLYVVSFNRIGPLEKVVVK